MKNDKNLLLNANINSEIISFDFIILDSEISLVHKISTKGEFAIVFYFKDETHYTSKIFDSITKELTYQVQREKVQFADSIRIVNIDSDEVIFSAEINLCEDEMSLPSRETFVQSNEPLDRALVQSNKPLASALVQADKPLASDKVNASQEVLSRNKARLDTDESLTLPSSKTLTQSKEPLDRTLVQADEPLAKVEVEISQELLSNNEVKNDNVVLNNDGLSQVEELISREDINEINEDTAPMRSTKERMNEVESNPNSILSILSDDMLKLELEEDVGLTVADILKELSEDVNSDEVVLRNDNVELAKKKEKVVKSANKDNDTTGKKHIKFKVKPKDIIENLSIIQEILKEKKTSSKATDSEEVEQENNSISLTNDGRKSDMTQSQSSELEQKNNAESTLSNKLKRGLKMKTRQDEIKTEVKEDAPIIHIHSKKGGLLSVAPSEEITTYCSPKATPKVPSNESNNHFSPKKDNNKVENYVSSKEPTTDSLNDELSHRAKINSLLDEMFEIRE